MIWYSHINEDNRAERKILLHGEYERVVCITGSGERVLALADAPSVRAFYAIDINPAANYLLEFKLAALKALGEKDYLAFCGLLGKRGKVETGKIEEILERLNPPCREFWENRKNWIRRGVAHCGHFESFLARVRPLLRIFLGKAFCQCFYQPFATLQQFPQRRWKFLLRCFANSWVYRLMGNRDPAFIAADGNLTLVTEGLQRTLEENRVASSFMFHLIFKGGLEAMPQEHLPPSARTEVLAGILEKFRDPGFQFHLLEGDLIDVIARWPSKDLSETFFSVSDILSFVDFDYLLHLLKMLKGEKATLVFRSFLRHGISPKQLETLSANFPVVVDISQEDQSQMYRVYQVQT